MGPPYPFIREHVMTKGFMLRRRCQQAFDKTEIDRPFCRQGGGVGAGDEIAYRAGRALQAGDHVADHAFGYRKLAVGEQLDRQPHQQGVVRRPQREAQQGAGTADQVGQNQVEFGWPIGGRGLRGQQQRRAALDQREQRCFGHAGRDILHHQRAIGDIGVQRGGFDRGSAGLLRPDGGEMRLARGGRAMQHGGGCRPVWK
jgi:hypothetical protein